jgi:AbrB family looped-hinge helix DNA binding protein
MDVEISKIGERGQLVIPQDFRDELHIKKGEKFLVVRAGHKLILQQVSRMKAKAIEELHEDLIDMKIAEQRMEEMKSGKVTKLSKKDFLNELESWFEE